MGCAVELSSIAGMYAHIFTTSHCLQTTSIHLLTRGVIVDGVGGGLEMILERDNLHSSVPSIPLDQEMIVFEGCDEDDKIVLGGKHAFLSHFCTFFPFNICHAASEAKSI